MAAQHLPARTIEKALGLVVKKRREACGLSQTALAEMAELHRTYVSQLERGLKSPSVRTLCGIAEALGTVSSALLRAAEDGLAHRS
jgi:transcriptional regulator with XRE-family HTH domain